MSVAPLHERRVLLDEILVHPAGGDDVIGDVVQDREIRARLEDDRDIGEVGAAVGEGREHGDLHMRMAEPAVGEARPQDRVHLRHVRAPQHERVGGLEIVVAAHRLVHAEGAHEGDGGGRHAVARIGIEIVGAEAGAHQFRRGIALEDRPLPGAEHADRGRALLLQHGSWPAAIVSKASSQLTGVNSPSLANTPFRLRSSGVVRRSPPYMIFDRK